MAKWSAKIRKSYKALSTMELHKSSEPKFANSLKVLQPILAKIIKKHTGFSVSPDIRSTGSEHEGLDAISSSVVKNNSYNNGPRNEL